MEPLPLSKSTLTPFEDNAANKKYIGTTRPLFLAFRSSYNISGLYSSKRQSQTFHPYVSCMQMSHSIPLYSFKLTTVKDTAQHRFRRHFCPSGQLFHHWKKGLTSPFTRSWISSSQIGVCFSMQQRHALESLILAWELFKWKICLNRTAKNGWLLYQYRACCLTIAAFTLKLLG